MNAGPELTMDNARNKPVLEKHAEVDRWQIEHKNKGTSQNQYLLENSTYSDCEFVVGDESNVKKFKAHRVLLAKASPVFAAMLCGPLAKHEEILIPDVDPEVFETLLQFVYIEKLKLPSLDLVAELCRVADMYDIPSLVQACVAELLNILQPNNACQFYEIGQQHICFAEVKNLAWKMIIERTDEVLEGEGFVDATQDTVYAISLQEELHIDSEAQLINACCKWATNEVTHRGVTNDTAGLLSVLGPVVKNLRCLCVSLVEFAQGPAKSNLFTADEKVAFTVKIGTPNDLTVEISNKFSNSVTAREKTSVEVPTFTFTNNISLLHASFNNGICKQHSSYSRLCTCCQNFQGVVPSSGSFATLCFTADSNIMLCGLCVPQSSKDWSIMVVDLSSHTTTELFVSKSTLYPVEYSQLYLSTSQRCSQINFKTPIPVSCQKTFKITITNANLHEKGNALAESVGANMYQNYSIEPNVEDSLIKGIVYKKQ